MALYTYETKTDGLYTFGCAKDRTRVYYRNTVPGYVKLSPGL